MSESRSLGEAIRLRRLDLGMSQEELAERIGPDVRQSDVSRLERGKILFPRLERLNQIASALGMSVGALLIEAGWFTDEESRQVETLIDPAARSPILVADDEPISLDAIVSVLDDHGYHAAAAYDFASLVGTIKAVAPEIVLIDIALPGLRYEALSDVLDLVSPRPILMFMGAGLPDSEIEEPYLEKPIDSRQLLSFVASVETAQPRVSPADNGSGRLTGT